MKHRESTQWLYWLQSVLDHFKVPPNLNLRTLTSTDPSAQKNSLNIFGLEIRRRQKAAPQNLQNVGYYNSWGPWWGPITESSTGAWQQNVVVAPTQTLLSFSAVYACVTGIASDIAKMRIKLSRNDGGIWEEITAAHGNSEASRFLPFLKKPNHYQTRIEFVEQWGISKLLYGNTYVLKQRDQARTVVAGYILHPNLVKPLVAENGDVYYEIGRDDLADIDDRKIVPASEIIHDRMPGLWHPLVGVSPLYACSVSTTMGNTIQSNSTNQFANGGRPSGIITVPGFIEQGTADRLKAAWETGYGSTNIGRTAVLSEGMTFTPVQFMTAEHQQLIEQLKWTVEDVARAFRYPLWKLGGPMPPYTKPELALTQYYSDCLHPHIEKLELCLDEGLGIPEGMGTELDLDTLMRMDTDALYESLNKAGNFLTVDEQRFKANYRPTKGGDSVYKQEQDHKLSWLSERDDAVDPGDAARESVPATNEPAEEEMSEMLNQLEVELRKDLALV